MTLGLELLIVLVAVGLTWRFVRAMAGKQSDLSDDEDSGDEGDTAGVLAPLNGGPSAKAGKAVVDEPENDSDTDAYAG